MDMPEVAREASRKKNAKARNEYSFKIQSWNT